MDNTTNPTRGSAAWATQLTQEARKQGFEQYSPRDLELHRALIIGEIDQVGGRGSAEHTYRTAYHAQDNDAWAGLREMLEDFGYRVTRSAYERQGVYGLCLIINWPAA
jgi:hypothetical protein